MLTSLAINCTNIGHSVLGSKHSANIFKSILKWQKHDKSVNGVFFAQQQAQH